MSSLVNRKILVVDDNESILLALDFNLKQAGYTPLKASGGREAYNIALREKPEIIISDIVMPEMDGIEFCKKLRTQSDFVDTPFIFLTAWGEPSDRVKGLKAGADDYIVKPFDIDELITRVEILHERLKRRTPAKGLSGDLSEVSIVDILQMFELTRKEGMMTITEGNRSGTVSFKEGLMADASFGGLHGEDAVCSLLPLKKGKFHFDPASIPDGPIMRPVHYMIMEASRLIDERSALTQLIPPGDGLVSLTGTLGSYDADVSPVIRLLKSGASTVENLSRKSGMSTIRLEIALGRLAKDGCLSVAKAEQEKPRDVEKIDHIAAVPGKPLKILFAFVNPSDAFRLLNVDTKDRKKGGFSQGIADFVEIKSGPAVFHFFLLKGEKKFSFMWEPVLATSDASIFLVSSPEDMEQLRYFRSKLPSSHPFQAVAVTRELVTDDLKYAGDIESIKAILSSFQNPQSNHRDHRGTYCN